MVLVPMLEQVHTEFWDGLVSMYPQLRADDLDLETPNRRLRTFLEQGRIPYVDLLSPLCQRAAMTGQLLYCLQDLHWNRWGSASAAEAVETYLHAHKLVP